MDNINVFKYSKMRMMSEQPPKVISWITVLIILVFIFISVGFFYRFDVYSTVIGYVDINDEYNLRIIIDKEEFPIKNDYELYIDNKKYTYEIIDIKESQQIYQVLINCNLEEELLVSNNIITIKLKKGKITLMDVLIKKIKEGII